MTGLVERPVDPAGPTDCRSALSTLRELHAATVEIPRPTPFATGFHPLDEVLHGGLRTGDLMLLGGKPGQGKTVAALQWARHIAQQGHTALFACYEHDRVTLLARLLACELADVAVARGVERSRMEGVLQLLREVVAGTRSLDEAITAEPLLLDAETALASYADRLVLARASGTRTDVGALGALAASTRGERTVLVVDYIQKIPVTPEPPDEPERVKRVAEGLKELALRERLAVIAVAAADRDGLTSRRLRLHHLRGSTALAYEADVALMLNDKLSAVSRVHLSYDTTRTDEFRSQVVFTVEKNRNGLTDVDLEFTKDFAHYRFDPHGRWVAERLWTEGSTEE